MRGIVIIFMICKRRKFSTRPGLSGRLGWPDRWQRQNIAVSFLGRFVFTRSKPGKRILGFGSGPGPVNRNADDKNQDERKCRDKDLPVDLREQEHQDVDKSSTASVNRKA